VTNRHAVILAQHYAVIPAEAGIHLLLLCFDRFGFLLKHIRVFSVRLPGGRVTSLCLPKEK